ncbi:MAG: hypothetical protein SFV55_20590 [Haliscomenobacter sp.]|uniref:hypothetical protein n=1 Tax=Haliscomenobacter sp. TaxID=2717303 RepID=UPI0029B972AE|nr:hypothetical protein [Haliscomenobacter sp.]MDX2070839.1 hypothetical protein [Haliscomenobacter sp.]
MRTTNQAAVYRNKIFAGILLEESRQLYTFRYDDAYFADTVDTVGAITVKPF